MPYPSFDSLPGDVKERFSRRCAEVWREVFNDTIDRYDDEGRAFATAEKAGQNCMDATERSVVSKTDKVLVSLAGPERRYVQLDASSMESVEDGDDALRFRGHAAVFNKAAYIGTEPYGFWERVAPGAFRQAINGGDVRLLINHDANYVLARQSNGTLRLSEDDTGLAVEADLAPTTYARDLSVLLKRGDVNQMSFSFLPVQQELVTNDSGEEVRELREVKVFDVSPVTFPAYEQTDAAMRSGLGLFVESLDLPDEQRARLVRAIRTGAVSPDLAPVLRAAGEALGALAQQFEPDKSTRAQGDDPSVLARESEKTRMRYRALVAMFGGQTPQ